MRRKLGGHIKRIVITLTGLMCGSTCAFYVMAEEPLKNLIIADGTAQVAEYEYSDKTFLESVYVPGSVQKIGTSAFEGCGALQNVQLQEGVSDIDNRAFALCKNMSSIAVPNSITRIGNAAFYNCSSLKDVILSDNISTIENNLFYQCGSLSNIAIPQSVKTIGQQSFYGCLSLTSIMLPQNLTSIGDGAFYNCTNLLNINIPDSVNYIGNDAFTGCSQLTVTCNPGSYAEQYAIASGFAVNTGQPQKQADLVVAEHEEKQVDSAAGQEKQNSQPENVEAAQTSNQSVVIPKTGIERPYLLCMTAVVFATVVLYMVKRKENMQ